MKLPPVDDVPEWEAPEKVSAWVRKLRAEKDELRGF
jgi:hypothetical protein